MADNRKCQRAKDVKYGHPVIMIPIGKPEDDKWFTMGFWKAKAVVDHFEEIEAWAIDQEHLRSQKRK